MEKHHFPHSWTRAGKKERDLEGIASARMSVETVISLTVFGWMVMGMVMMGMGIW